MEKNPKKSKALIITIILIVLLLIAGYFIFKNKDSIFKIKTSTNTFTSLPASENKPGFLAKIFSPLLPSSNSKNLDTGENIKTTYAEAGENIKKGDIVYKVGTNKNNLPIVRKTGLQNQNKFGTALEDINMGSFGNIAVDSSFWGSIKDFFNNTTGNIGNWVGGIFRGNGGTGPSSNTCTNGATNPTLCTTIGGNCINNATNPPLCTTMDNDTNIFPTVTVIATPASIAKGESSTISWESTNADACNAGTGNGTGKTGSFSTGILQSSRSYTVTCTGVNGTGSGNILVAVGGGGNVCPTGWTGTYPNCTDPNSNSCPAGWTGTFPNCTNTGNCPVGWTGTYPVCTDPNSNVCPAGWMGTYPDCTDPNSNSCPVGWTGTFPNCTNIGGCPLGWTGTYPDCIAPNFIFPSVTVWATPPIVEYGEKSEIGWESKNTEYCVEGAVGNASPDGSVNNKKGIKGKLTTGALLSSKSFTITCYDKNGGGVSGSVVVFVNLAGVPDLRATDPTPTTVLVGVNTMFYSDIINQGTASTGETTFYNIMQWAKPAFTTTTTGATGATSPDSSDSTGGSSSSETNTFMDESKLIPIDLPKVRMKTIPAGESQPFTIVYNFKDIGTYYIRVCADKQSQTDAGNINEGTNENNNCSNWVAIAVTNSLPTPCPQLTDATGKCVSVDECLALNKIVSGDQCVDDPSVCPPPKIKDTTGKCIDASEVIPPNICKDIEQNPLTFTPEEKARLAVLLRKFYLISSTLRTSDDISTIYSDIDQQKIFMGQIDGLTKQCYLQINDTDGYKNFCSRNPSLCKTTDIPTSGIPTPGYKDNYYTQGQNLTLRRGNPWYQKTSGGTFPYTGNNVFDKNGVSIKDPEGKPITAGYMDYNWLEGNYIDNGNGNYSPYLSPSQKASGASSTASSDGPGCKVVSGYYYGTLTRDVILTKDTPDIGILILMMPYQGIINAAIEALTPTKVWSAGESCDKFNLDIRDDQNNLITNNCYYNNTKIFGNWNAPPSQTLLESGCKWVDGVDMINTERILNIW
ncbi:MAG: hypothetical protein WC908_02360 [Candidatus Paceibacterota bacterium]